MGTEMVTETGTEREGWKGPTRTGNGDRDSRGERGWERGTETKMSQLVEDVLEYQEFHEEEGAN